MKTGDRRLTGDRGQETGDRRRPSAILLRIRPLLFCLPSPVSCLLFLSLLIVTGCVWPGSRKPSLPGRTTLDSPLVILPAQSIGNYLLLEVKWDRYGPYHFLIDTGSSVTLVTPALARRYPGRLGPPPGASPVRVAGANGNVTELPRGSLRRLELGDAHFEDIDVLLYDCAPLSAHLGVRIDGVLGFPLFRETLLTLDYPGSRVVLQPVRNETTSSCPRLLGRVRHGHPP